MGSEGAPRSSTLVSLRGSSRFPTGRAKLSRSPTSAGTEFECFWGSVFGFGLAPNAPIQVSSGAGPIGLNFSLTTEANGSVDADLNLTCDLSITGYHAITTTPSGATITSNAVDGPGVECAP
jgi:hypothetical protein